MQELTITIERPIGSVGSSQDSNSSQTMIDHSAVINKHVNSELQKIDTLCTALTNAIEQTNQTQSQIVEESKQQIGALAVEIAELVLNDKISKKDYDIENIIANSIEKISDKRDMEIDINPIDHQTCTSIIEKNYASPLATLKLNADPSVPAAQCRIKTKNGITESFFKEQLEKIALALSNINQQ